MFCASQAVRCCILLHTCESCTSNIGGAFFLYEVHVILSYKIMKVTPSVEELIYEPSKICSETNCSKAFKSSSNLLWHLKKHHGITKENESHNSYVGEADYHCPVDGCIYRLPSERFFTSYHRLKQHYMKVHAEKKYTCLNCEKGFSRQNDLKRHDLVCGVVFVCSCDYKYNSHEALLTHARRYSHTIPEEFQSKPKKLKLNPKSENKERKNNAVVNRPAKILPKSAPISCLPLPTVAAIALSELAGCESLHKRSKKSSSSTQTNVSYIQELNIKNGREVKGLKLKKCKNSTETQTTSTNLRSLKSAYGNIKSCGRKNKAKSCASIESQTNLSGLMSKKNCNRNQVNAKKVSHASEKISKLQWDCLDKEESIPFHISQDVMLSSINQKKNSSATQTSPRLNYSWKTCNGHTETSLHSRSPNLENIFDANVSYLTNNAVQTQTDSSFQNLMSLDFLGTESCCETLNSETQTSENYLELIDYSQLFSNMETQTGDNNDELFPLELSFSNIHTQTSFQGQYENELISIETQTMDERSIIL